MVPVLMVKGNVVEPRAPEKANAEAVVKSRIRRAADDPAKAWVPVSGRIRAKNGNGMKTNRRKGGRRCKNATF
jgi:hypothetical protein